MKFMHGWGPQAWSVIMADWGQANQSRAGEEVMVAGPGMEGTTTM